MEACEAGKTDFVKMLLKRGAKWDVKNEKGETPLQMAIKKKHGKVVALLKEAGAKE